MWARTFDTIEELRAALVEFARHYNETWLVARHGNRTPAQVRAAQSQLDQNAMADLKPEEGQFAKRLRLEFSAMGPPILLRP